MKTGFFRSALSACSFLFFFFLAFHVTIDAQTGFIDPDIGGAVSDVALQPDGKIIVGGSFATVAGQSRSRVARVNANGSLDTSFQDPQVVGPDAFNNQVFAVALQADGKVVIGGLFVSVGGQTRNYVARLNADGTLDSAFTPDVANSVTAIAIQPDGKIVIGGYFVSVNGQTRNHVARLNTDGSIDSSFGDPVITTPAPSLYISALGVQPDGKILIGGNFTSVGGQPRSGGTRLNSNGSLDSAFALSAPGSVEQFKVFGDGRIIICGFFSTVNGVSRRAIARINSDGTLDPTFGDTAIPSGNITTFDIQSDGKIVVGGDFSIISGGERNDVARLNTDGSFDPTFQDPNTNFGGTFFTISDLVLQPDGKVLIGGQFNMIGRQTRKNLVRLLSDGTIDLPPVQTFRVTKTADTNDGVCDSDCSLREAIAVANAITDGSPVAIDFNPDLSGSTITLTGGELVIEQNRRVGILGPGAGQLTISGNNASRVLRIRRDVNATVVGVTIANGNGAGDSSFLGGGAIYVEPNGVVTSLTINHSVISNSSSGTGGGIRTLGISVLNINNSTITGNTATTSPAGAGIYFDNGMLNITDSSVSGNIATFSPTATGGIGIGNSSAVFSLSGSNVSGNFGRGLAVGGATTITNTTISNNVGGGLYVSGTASVTGGVISGNTVAGPDGQGAGIFNFGRLTITNGLITANQSAFGAGIFTSGGLTMAGTSITGNVASNTGGGIYNNIGGSSGQPVSMTGCVISGNTSGSFAGGIQNRAAMTIDQSTISDNMTALGGGGAYNVFQAVEPAVLTITRSTVSGNRSDSGGGGLQNQNGTINLTNSTVSSNKAGGAGGAIAISSNGIVNLSFATIAFNTANTTGGIRITSGTVNADNSIIARNIGRNSGADIFGQLTSLGYNLIGDMSGATIIGDTTGNQLNTNPRLDPVLKNNGGATFTHALQPNSPAIDGGKSSGSILVDQRGSSRPVDLGSFPNAPGGNGADIGSFELQSSDVSHFIAPFDFDGDGKTDIGISRPLAAMEWWINRSSTGQTFALQFGSSSDKIVPADYTGDGKADIAFFRPSSGEWYVLRSEDNSFFAFPFGTNGDVPAPADFDGDGKADAAVFRSSNATWYISQSSGAATRIVQFGAAGDIPIASDFDGDGKADVAVFRPVPTGAEWWINRSTEGLLAMQFGASTDKPVIGDYTGDGKTDIALWRPTTGEWYIIRSEDLSYYAFPFGSSGDTPASGDYDGDGKSDPAVFRPSTATWFIARSTAGTQIVQFGASGDRPIPNAFVP